MFRIKPEVMCNIGGHEIAGPEGEPRRTNTRTPRQMKNNCKGGGKVLMARDAKGTYGNILGNAKHACGKNQVR